MGDPYVQIWDGTNKATVTNGKLDVSSAITGGSVYTIPSSVSAIGSTTVQVGLSATQILSINAARAYVLIENKGTTNIWLNGLSNVLSGASTINFSALAAGQRISLERYTGVLWGIANGVSGVPMSVGVAEFS